MSPIADRVSFASCGGAWALKRGRRAALSRPHDQADAAVAPARTNMPPTRTGACSQTQPLNLLLGAPRRSSRHRERRRPRAAVRDGAGGPGACTSNILAFQLAAGVRARRARCYVSPTRLGLAWRVAQRLISHAPQGRWPPGARARRKFAPTRCRRYARATASSTSERGHAYARGGARGRAAAPSARAPSVAASLLMAARKPWNSCGRGRGVGRTPSPPRRRPRSGAPTGGAGRAAGAARKRPAAAAAAPTARARADLQPCRAARGARAHGSAAPPAGAAAGGVRRSRGKLPAPRGRRRRRRARRAFWRCAGGAPTAAPTARRAAGAVAARAAAWCRAGDASIAAAPAVEAFARAG